MKPAIDYSKEIRRKLTEGRTLDEALADLRASGASIIDCVFSVQAFHRCEIAEAKQIVESSSAWSDYREVTDEVLRIWSEPNNNAKA